MEKDKLDRLFQERLHSLSEVPDDKVWAKIEASLEKKKKRRVVPIWWWHLGGAAAAVSLLIYFINPFQAADNSIQGPPVTDYEKSTPVELKNSHDIPEVYSSTPNNIPNGLAVKDSSITADSNIKAIEKEKLVKNKTIHKEEALSGLAASAEQTPSGPLNPKQDTFQRKERSQKEIADSRVASTTGISEQKTAQKSASPKDTLLIQEKVAVAITGEEMDDGTISIYDAIEKKNKEQDSAMSSQKVRKWTVGTAVAPVFYSSFGEGSPIHSNFVPNSKSGNLNLSYGLNVSYALNKKLSIRSGLHRVDLSYDTNDILISSANAVSETQIENIDYSATTGSLILESGVSAVPTITEDGLEVSEDGTTTLSEGLITQQLGYVELPLEFNYTLLDKKIGINLIGGFSSLFLIENAINLESQQLNTQIGTANNANSVNFSTNFGLGFRYGLSKKLQLNVEPILKYQLNTFSNSAGDFRPYAIGVYSGLNYRF